MKITVPIVPKGQMRARHSTVNGFSQTHKDPKQAREEEALMAILAKYQPQEYLPGPSVGDHCGLRFARPHWYPANQASST